jgi:Zn-dependent protease with chaperone function
MMAQVIGHELGHIALGHTLGTSANLEVSRNQEREADSFASSVLSTCPFGEYLVAGPVVWELIWVWCEHAGNRRIAATHPLSKERLMEFIRANKDESEAIGMCESTIREFMPPGS